MPKSACLIHIGVHKTGTTSLQAALRQGREELLAHGLFTQGPFDPSDPGQAVSGRRAMLPDPMGFEGPWARHRGQLMLSSEYLCVANERQAQTVVSRFAGDRPVHILVTIRSLVDMLPSSWQQRVRAPKSIRVPDYQKWATALVQEATRKRSEFWRRNNYARLLRVWGNAVGEGNMTFVVVNKEEPDRVFRSTEALLGLPIGTLVQTKPGQRNRSLTYPEAELLRRAKLEMAEAVPDTVRETYARRYYGRLKRQPGQGASIPILAQSVEELRPIALQYAAVLRDSRAQIVGDLEELALPSAPPVLEVKPPTSVPIDVAVGAVVSGAKLAKGEVEQQPWHQRILSRFRIRRASK